jgi:UDP-3-O-[3-hydroxymyristoyl] glucosamine N-acyltransferase
LGADLLLGRLAVKLSDIAQRLPAKLIGDAALDIRRVVHPLDANGPGDLAVALSKEAAAINGGSTASAVLIAASAAVPSDGRSVLVYAGHERMALAVLTAMFDPGPARATGIHPSAVIAADASVGPSVAIGANVSIGSRAVVGARTTVLANVTIGAGAAIGSDCVIHPGVVIGDGVTLRDRVIVQPNAVIGADGFSFLPVRNPDGTPGAGGLPARIHSLGTVVIEDDVEIGAGTTIDRATLRATRIGRGTKIDNLVQIGHNVTIGEACLICGQVGIAGSCVIGNRVLIAAGCGLSDHVTVGDDAVVMAMSGVGMDIKAGEAALGIPAVSPDLWKQRYMQVGRLKRLYAQVNDLTERLAALEKAATEDG